MENSLTFSLINFFDFDNKDINYTKSIDNFTVKEEPLYPFDNEGDYIIAMIEKKNISTWDMCKVISEHTGIKAKDIGYCGLKDKIGITTQYISLSKEYEQQISKFNHENIKILNTSYHTNKLRIGHLKGNHFTILIDNIEHFDTLKSRLDMIDKFGIPNYFGYQRFGVDKENFIIGKDIVDGKRYIRQKHKSKFFISAYQSYLFNQWLDERITLSKDTTKEDLFANQEHPFKLLDGELYLHYPYGRVFQSEDIAEESKRFFQKDIAPTGLIAGERVLKSSNKAYEFEQPIDIINKQTSKLSSKQMLGARRFAWIFPKDLSIEKQSNKIKMEFFLPKGSYATVLLGQLGISIKGNI